MAVGSQAVAAKGLYEALEALAILPTPGFQIAFPFIMG